MQAAVRGFVGADRGFDQRHGYGIAVNIVSVFTVVEQGNAVALFGQIHPFLCAHLEFGKIPFRVHVGGPLNITALYFIGCAGGMNIHREVHPQKHLFFLPVHLGAEIDPFPVTVYRHVLADHRRAESKGLAQNGFHRPLRYDLPFCQPGSGIRLILIINVNIPGIEPLRLVFKGGKHIQRLSAAHFPIRLLVINGVNLAVLPENNPIKPVFHHIVVNAQLTDLMFRMAFVVGCSALGSTSEHRIPIGRNIFYKYQKSFLRLLPDAGLSFLTKLGVFCNSFRPGHQQDIIPAPTGAVPHGQLVFFQSDALCKLFFHTGQQITSLFPQPLIDLGGILVYLTDG